jgi:hypothetical protein
MCFDVSLPFVRQVYDLVVRGELDQCQGFLKDLIRERPHTRLHCALDCDFGPCLHEYSAWLFDGCKSAANLDPSVAIATSMGEFEVNYHDWRADAIIYTGFHDPPSPYDWIANSKGRLLCEWFHFTGFAELREAFEFALDYVDDPPISPDTFTASCYFVFVHFLLLNRNTHQLAKVRGLGLGLSHLFCHYGDLLYHSRPGSATSS